MNRFTNFIFLLIATVAYCQNWIPYGDNIYGEASGDSFGNPTVLNDDGSRIAVGAIFNDSNGNNSGQVRVFEYQSGQWIQLGQAINGESEDDVLGIAIDMNDEGSRIVVNSRFDFSDTSGSYIGDARVYEYQSGQWTLLGDKIIGPSSLVGLFAWDVSMNASGNIVAASMREWEGVSGLVRVYQLNNGTWEQLGNDIEGSPEEVLGTSVDLNASGNIVAVGVPGYDNGSTLNVGAIRVYELVGNNWIQLGDDIIGVDEIDEIGEAIDLNDAGNILASGEHEANGSFNDTGRVRVFQYSSGNWTQIGNSILGTEEDDRLGRQISINTQGDIISTIQVWDIQGLNNIGKVGSYKFDGATWQPRFQSIEGENSGDGFGSYMSMSKDGNYLSIGAVNIGNNGNDTGTAYVYVNDQILDSNNFNQSNSILFPNPNDGNFNLNIENSNFPITVEIFNALGKSVYTNKFYTTPLEIKRPLSEGLYFITLVNENETIKTFKFIVE